MICAFCDGWVAGLMGDAEAAALWSPEAQLGHMIAFEAALAHALETSGRVPAGQGTAAAAAIESASVDIGVLAAGTLKDGVPVPSLVKQLRAAAGEAAAAVHTGATSQDVVDTALVLILKGQTDLLLDRLDRLATALDDLSSRHGAVPLMARTRMQAALPVTVADRVAAWRAPLAGHAARLRALRPEVERLQLGGPVGTGGSLGAEYPLIVADVAARLGLHAPQRAWHSDRSALAAHASALAGIAGNLGKIGQDVALMAQQGLDEIKLAGGGGSSAMAHKSNPVLAELLVTLGRHAATLSGGMQHALIHEQERSGAAWTLEWLTLPPLSMAAARAASAALALVAQIERIGTP